MRQEKPVERDCNVLLPYPINVLKYSYQGQGVKYSLSSMMIFYVAAHHKESNSNNKI